MRAFRSASARGYHLQASTALAFVVAAADLAIKWLVERSLAEPISLIADVRLELGHNSGIAFGALNDLPSWVLVAGVASFLAGLVVAVARGLLPLPWPAIGLLLGGGLANLIDRIGDGRVTDFIDAPRWPAFNLADIAITSAVLLTLWHVANEERRGKDARPPTEGSRSSHA